MLDIGKKEFSCGLTFVACSRVRHVTDLLFTPPFTFQRLSSLSNSLTLQPSNSSPCGHSLQDENISSPSTPPTPYMDEDVPSPSTPPTPYMDEDVPSLSTPPTLYMDEDVSSPSTPPTPYMDEDVSSPSTPPTPALLFFMDEDTTHT